MNSYAVTRTLPWSCEQLFDLAADVASYPEFLPGWQEVRILERSAQQLRVYQRLGLGALNHAFTSTAQLQRPGEVLISATEAPFQHLRIHWEFTRSPRDGCQVSLGIEVRTGSSVLEIALARLFEITTPEVIAHFESRARKLYGEPQDAVGLV